MLNLFLNILLFLNLFMAYKIKILLRRVQFVILILHSKLIWLQVDLVRIFLYSIGNMQLQIKFIFKNRVINSPLLISVKLSTVNFITKH
ncbi:hypothetical protein [Leptospira interrogans]|uniref:hypothetical protein n=1 Tax=Leptospira interrogans TaxID=173 RepID=UPI0007740256|nr:hypothetical protein [Leptospira interrogans]